MCILHMLHCYTWAKENDDKVSQGENVTESRGSEARQASFFEAVSCLSRFAGSSSCSKGSTLHFCILYILFLRRVLSYLYSTLAILSMNLEMNFIFLHLEML